MYKKWFKSTVLIFIFLIVLNVFSFNKIPVFASTTENNSLDFTIYTDYSSLLNKEGYKCPSVLFNDTDIEIKIKDENFKKNKKYKVYYQCGDDGIKRGFYYGWLLKDSSEEPIKTLDKKLKVIGGYGTQLVKLTVETTDVNGNFTVSSSKYAFLTDGNFDLYEVQFSMLTESLAKKPKKFQFQLFVPKFLEGLDCDTSLSINKSISNFKSFCETIGKKDSMVFRSINIKDVKSANTRTTMIEEMVKSFGNEDIQYVKIKEAYSSFKDINVRVPFKPQIKEFWDSTSIFKPVSGVKKIVEIANDIKPFLAFSSAVNNIGKNSLENYLSLIIYDTSQSKQLYTGCNGTCLEQFQSVRNNSYVLNSVDYNVVKPRSWDDFGIDPMTKLDCYDIALAKYNKDGLLIDKESQKALFVLFSPELLCDNPYTQQNFVEQMKLMLVSAIDCEKVIIKRIIRTCV